MCIYSRLTVAECVAVKPRSELTLDIFLPIHQADLIFMPPFILSVQNIQFPFYCANLRFTCYKWRPKAHYMSLQASHTPHDQTSPKSPSTSMTWRPTCRTPRLWGTSWPSMTTRCSGTRWSLRSVEVTFTTELMKSHRGQTLNLRFPSHLQMSLQSTRTAATWRVTWASGRPAASPGRFWDHARALRTASSASGRESPAWL